MSSSAINLSGLSTEARNLETANIDKLDSYELVQLLHQQDLAVFPAVESCLAPLSRAIDATVDRIHKGGKVFYVGSGTSGRLGVLDASELVPTFNAPPKLFNGLISGGDYALRNAVEDAEDNRSAAVKDLSERKLGPDDVLVAIAASGRTPYCLSGLEYARSLGAYTIGLCCVQTSEMTREGNCDEIFSAVTGPESVTGSTRMKAGTATKLILNMYSSSVMIKLGKTYKNYMVDVRTTNKKLVARARHIIRSIVGDNSQIPIDNDAQIDSLLSECNNSVKLAIAVAMTGMSAKEASVRLEQNGGRLAPVIDNVGGSKVNNQFCNGKDQQLLLCIDGGGSKTVASLASSQDGKILATGKSGPSNLTTYGVDHVMTAIKSAMAEICDPAAVSFARVWIGLAGCDRPRDFETINPSLYKLFSATEPQNIYISSDALLTAGVPKSTSENDKNSGITIISGTGSIGFLWEKQESSGLPRKVRRVGGYGALLGDDGSAFSIGKAAIRHVLTAIDINEHVQNIQDSDLKALCEQIIKYFQENSTEIVQANRSQISKCANVVTTLAEENQNQLCTSILREGAQSIVGLIKSLSASSSSPSSLSFGGGLLINNKTFQQYVIDYAVQDGCNIDGYQIVSDSSINGINWLLNSLSKPKNN